LTPKTDWTSIQARYEAGEGYADISNSLGGKPTRQAIHQKSRKQGWIRQLKTVDGTLLPAVQMPQHLIEGLEVEKLAVLRGVLEGLTPSDAAAVAGLHKQRVTDWKKSDGRFLLALDAARSLKTRRRQAKIDDDPTWKSAAWLLQHDPDSKNDYSNEGGKGNLVGNTFNVLGRIDLGIERPPLTAPEPVTEG